MGERDIRKALELCDILEGIRNFLLIDDNVKKLINKGISHLMLNSRFTFQKQKNEFKKYILVDFQDIIEYTKEDVFNETTYFNNRKFIKELNNEYYLFYTYLSEEIKTEKNLHDDIKDNLSYIFKETYAKEHQKRL